jgi:hypothetical protein
VINVRVEAYAGYKADERPLRFFIGERCLNVESVEDRWQSPGFSFFRIKASDGNIYILKRDEGQDTWTLESFRAD